MPADTSDEAALRTLRDRIAALERELLRRDRRGTAVGFVMMRQRVSRDEAQRLLDRAAVELRVDGDDLAAGIARAGDLLEGIRLAGAGAGPDGADLDGGAPTGAGPRPDDDLAALQSKAANLELAFGSREVIGTAKGILMAQRGITDQAAFEVLAARSRETNLRISTLAEGLISTGDLDAAVTLARTAGSGTGTAPGAAPGTAPGPAPGTAPGGTPGGAQPDGRGSSSRS